MVGNESQPAEQDRRQQRQLHPEANTGNNAPGRSRSRPREEGTAPATTSGDDAQQSLRRMEEAKTQLIKRSVEDEFAQAIPQDTMKSIKKYSLDLASKVERLQKTNARLRQQQEEIAILEQNRVPNGMKPVPYPHESAFLDIIMIDKDAWTVEFPEGTSLREARQLVHCSYLKLMREMDQKVTEQQRLELRSSTRKSVFVDKCVDTYKEKTSLWKDLDLDLEDEPDTDSITEEVLRVKASNVYDKTIDHAAILVQKKKEQEKLQQRKKDEILKDMLQKSPEDLLRMTIDARIEERMPGKNYPSAKSTAKQQKAQQTARQFNSAKAFVASTQPNNDESMMDPQSLNEFWVPSSQAHSNPQGKTNKGGNKGGNKGAQKGKGKG